MINKFIKYVLPTKKILLTPRFLVSGIFLLFLLVGGITALNLSFQNADPRKSAYMIGGDDNPTSGAMPTRPPYVTPYTTPVVPKPVQNSQPAQQPAQQQQSAPTNTCTASCQPGSCSWDQRAGKGDCGNGQYCCARIECSAGTQVTQTSNRQCVSTQSLQSCYLNPAIPGCAPVAGSNYTTPAQTPTGPLPPPLPTLPPGMKGVAGMSGGQCYCENSKGLNEVCAPELCCGQANAPTYNKTPFCQNVAKVKAQLASAAQTQQQVTTSDLASLTTTCQSQCNTMTDSLARFKCMDSCTVAPSTTVHLIGAHSSSACESQCQNVPSDVKQRCMDSCAYVRPAVVIATPSCRDGSSSIGSGPGMMCVCPISARIVRPGESCFSSTSTFPAIIDSGICDNPSSIKTTCPPPANGITYTSTNCTSTSVALTRITATRICNENAQRKKDGRPLLSFCSPGFEINCNRFRSKKEQDIEAMGGALYDVPQTVCGGMTVNGVGYSDKSTSQYSNQITTCEPIYNKNTDPVVSCSFMGQTMQVSQGYCSSLQGCVQKAVQQYMPANVNPQTGQVVGGVEGVDYKLVKQGNGTTSKVPIMQFPSGSQALVVGQSCSKNTAATSLHNPKNGCRAIDFNVAQNSGNLEASTYTNPNVNMPPEFVSAMEDCKIEWGGRYNGADGVSGGCDPMHFSYAPACFSNGTPGSST